LSTSGSQLVKRRSTASIDVLGSSGLQVQHPLIGSLEIDGETARHAKTRLIFEAMKASLGKHRAKFFVDEQTNRFCKNSFSVATKTGATSPMAADGSISRGIINRSKNEYANLAIRDTSNRLKYLSVERAILYAVPDFSGSCKQQTFSLFCPTEGVPTLNIHRAVRAANHPGS
jgi:hypothetical protein